MKIRSWIPLTLFIVGSVDVSACPPAHVVTSSSYECDAWIAGQCAGWSWQDECSPVGEGGGGGGNPGGGGSGGGDGTGSGGDSGGGGSTVSRVATKATVPPNPNDPKAVAVIDCLKSNLEKYAGKGNVQSQSSDALAVKNISPERISLNRPDLWGGAINKQMPKLSGGEIVFPESSSGISYVMDPNASGSFAWALSRLKSSGREEELSRYFPGGAQASLNGYTGWSGFTAAAFGEAFHVASGWSEAFCREFWLQHEKGHDALFNSGHIGSTDPGSQMERVNAFFASDGTPTADGYGLMRALASYGVSIGVGLNEIAQSIQGVNPSLANALRQAAGKGPC